LAGFLDTIRGWFAPPRPAQRGLTQEQLWGSGWSAMASSAGTPTDIENALKSIAVQAAMRLLVNDIGSLPVDAFRKVDGQQRKELTQPSWISQPNPLNPNETWEDHIKEVVFSVLSDGNGFVRCHPNVFQVEGLEALDPGSVDIDRFRGSTIYPVRGEGDLSPAEILHIPWVKRPGKARGLNPIEAAKEGIGIALAADQFVGSYFGNGATLGGIVKYPVGTSMTDEQIKEVLKGLNKAHQGAKKAHALGALTDGGDIVYPEYNNRNAQLLELREHIVEEVARLFGIPPHMLGSQRPGAVSYASVEQRSIDYVTHAVLPITRRLGTGYSRILRGQRTYLKFNVRGLLAGDASARASYYDSLLQNKVIKREEVRALEDLEWDGELGYLETPNNNEPAAPV
jgi:HK97 family phage portal protein